MHPSEPRRDRPLVVTAADARFARTLWQFLRSAERRRAVEGLDWLAWDLGMEPEQLAGLRRRFPWCGFRRFDASAHPPHVRVSAGTWAWKPVIVVESARDRGGPVLWADSGAIVRPRFREVFDEIRRTGVLTLWSKTAIGRKADPRTLARTGLAPELWGVIERPATIFGFDAGDPTACDLIRRWAAFCEDPETIAPVDAMPGHKFDQAVLNCVLIAATAEGRLASLPVGDIDISSGRPVAWFTTRNKVDPRLPTWTDPLCRLWYWTYKTVDQALHRRAERKRARGGDPGAGS
mgnify:CR=1 FL=1